MGNQATHQETCDAVSHPDFEEKSLSHFFYDPFASFRVNNGRTFLKSRKKTNYSHAKTVWPLPSHEVPFFPEFPIRSGTSEHSFNVISVVSSGAFGKVLQVIHKLDAKNYAMKIMSKSMIFKENLVHQVKTEAQIQVMCDHHPFLVHGPFRWQNKRNLFIVTDFIEGGDLQQIWQDTGSFHEDLIKIYVAEVALVLDFLHNAGIIYRDLKMENLLIDGSGHLKLIDFGLSKWLSFGDRCHTICGTRQYMGMFNSRMVFHETVS
ncbi:hypothetical protein DAPPUDRAFT_312552 [Daphnia pulex]|uniref:Protein kinase domain-containing protein n=1 Tax=Daphnia pulex TaxID=6669 RepID=E9FZF9_DAPPU|nr:hypothetical protein DAPPUDRAFT_312552 [Daphnia pulex]|eukprot:EFX87050.1 hypothetical protein DAPPUDRAFT_312552 [Daphnia pulex]